MIAVNLKFSVERALQTINANMETFADRFPENTTTGNWYPLRQPQSGFVEGDNYGWTTSFWSGMLWLAYEFTGEARYLQLGERHIQNFAHRVENAIDLDTHDIGFLYTLACVAPWRLTGDLAARQAALQAAEALMARYLAKIGIFQAWGGLDDPKMRGNTIIDSLMNMPLLYWATEQTGDPRFAAAAHYHSSQLRDQVVRPDNSTYHTFYWNPETGAPIGGSTAQGHAGNSCWARGQAWAIYGFALSYRYTHDESLLVAAQRCADYFLDHLPEDHVVYWDLVFGDDSGQPRDSSAAAIAVCGLQELAHWIPEDAQRQRYQSAAETILTSLVTNYAASLQSGSNALLLHSVYDMPKNIGVDEGCLWGDFFYMEALMRSIKPEWQLYW
ncbi:MAG: glycoside hydrolase family 88 protein [Chloroflexi bacterium]|nr:glycoside hydrolase family 88 protein [Chloroflexota bacterium]